MERIELILHIGRHKTGTTALQEYFANNTDYLGQSGYYYPKVFMRENAHHILSEYLSSTEFLKLQEVDKQKKIAQLREELIADIRSSSNSKVIMSSEAFQNVRPRFVRALFLKDSFNVKVVAYFREIVGYTASSYNQEVHAKIFDESIDDFIERFRPNYLSFADEWSESFTSFKAKIFDKNCLVNGNVVDDFLIEELSLGAHPNYNRISNPSLGSKYLSFKLEYNRRVKDYELPHLIDEGKLYVILGMLSKNDEKFKLSSAQKERVILNASGSDKEFYKKYIGEGEFNYQESGEDNAIVNIKGKRFWDIYNLIDNHEWPLRF